jgi:hypothetical protein
LRYNDCNELIEALHGLARQSTEYVPPQSTATAYVAPRGPSTTPMRSSPSLLTAVQHRPAPPPTPPEQITPAPSRPRLQPPPSSRIVPPAAPPPQAPPPVAPPSFWQLIKESLLFWKPPQDRVGLTLLTPNSVLPGESLGLQAVVHSAARTAQAQSLPDWRGSVALTQALKRGSVVNVHVAVQEITVTKPLQQVKWAGFSAATIFNVRVPESWPVGLPLQGTLTISADQTPIGTLDFSVPIGAPNSPSQV